MSNPNPFVPKGSLLEQQSQRRSRLKIAVLCVVVVGATGLLAMLIQGCKRDTGVDINPPDQTTNSPDTNNMPPVDTNPVVPMPTNGAMALPPGGGPGTAVAPLPPVVPPVEPPVAPQGGTEYVVVHGDTLGHIAHKNGVSLKALETANPGVDAKHLKVGQKLTLPAGSTGGGSAAAPGVAATGDESSGSGTLYTVKAGDSLYKIARKFGVSVKAIENENGMSTTRINVGKKLKIPTKAGAKTNALDVPVTTPAPVTAPAPADMTPPTTTAPASAPAAPANQ
jgi:LysM repeat protein